MNQTNTLHLIMLMNNTMINYSIYIKWIHGTNFKMIYIHTHTHTYIYIHIHQIYWERIPSSLEIYSFLPFKNGWVTHGNKVIQRIEKKPTIYHFSLTFPFTISEPPLPSPHPLFNPRPPLPSPPRQGLTNPLPPSKATDLSHRVVQASLRTCEFSSVPSQNQYYRSLHRPLIYKTQKSDLHHRSHAPPCVT